MQVHWNDALRLALILGQLPSLSIHGSINAQISYVLRSDIESFMHSIVRGAPNLEELGFHSDYFPLAGCVSAGHQAM